MCRYVNDMRQAEKLRKPVAKWWHTTLRPLRAAEIHATSSHLSSQTATAPYPNGSPPPSHAVAAAESAKKLRHEVGCTCPVLPDGCWGLLQMPRACVRCYQQNCQHMDAHNLWGGLASI